MKTQYPFAENAKSIAEKTDTTFDAQNEVFRVGEGKKKYTLERAMEVAWGVKQRVGCATIYHSRHIGHCRGVVSIGQDNIWYY